MTIENEGADSGMADDINDMLGVEPEAGEGEEEEFDDPTTDDEEEEEVSGEEEEEEVGAAANKGEEDLEEDSDDVVEVVDDIEALRARIAELSAPQTPAPAKEGEEEVNPLDIFKEDIAYITEENLAEIADNPLLLNEAMNSVRRQTAENILNLVPTMIGNALQAHQARQELHNKFYGANPELAPYKQYVSVVAKEIQSKHPDKSQEEILDAVAKSVKTSLKLDTKKVEKKGKKGGVKPALPKARGGGKQSKSEVDSNSTAAQIAELL